MTLYYVNTGSGPNTHDGDSLRTAFNKINANFAQINTGSLGAVLVQSPSVPQGYGPGTLWYDTESGRTYIYYNNSWVDANPSSNQNQNIITVGLFDPDNNTLTNVVSNVSHLNFDSLADFSVTDQGNGSVLVGMNSTFKYINIEGQTGLAAQGVDTLNLVAGTGTQIILSNQGIKNQQTITFISTGSGSGGGTATFPVAVGPGYLYNDGIDNISWQAVELNQLTNGANTFVLNSNGTISFAGGTQTVPYKSPLSSSVNNAKYIIFRSASNDLEYNASFTYNPSTGALSGMKTLTFADRTVQSTAWLGSTSTLYTSTGTYKSTVLLTTSTLKLSTGTITFPDLTVQRTAFTGTVDYSNITNIPVVTTSSLNNNGFSAVLTTTGSFVIPMDLTVPYSETNVFSIFAQSSGGVLASVTTTTSVTIQTTSTNQTYNWVFNNDGTITFPDNTKQTSAGRTTYDSIFSGTKYLSIANTGAVKFPDGTDQKTAFVGSATILFNNGYQLRPVAVPRNLNYGSPSDLAGDIAFDQSYIYYCVASYGYKTYTTTAFTSGTNVNYFYVTQASTLGNIPKAGWTYQQAGNSTVYTLASDATSAVVGPIAVFRLSVTPNITYTTATVFTITNTTIQQANWVKSSVSNTGLVSNVSKFVNQNDPVATGILTVRWNPYVVQGRPILRLAISALSGKLYDIVYSCISNYSPGSYAAQGSITELTATPVEIGPDAGTTGDSATMIINSTSSNFCYRITAMVGNNLLNNFISIEQIQ